MAEIKTEAGNLLIVDDTLENLRLLTEMLREQGYNVRAAPDAAMARTAIRNYPPELILLDVNMPGMDGYELAEYLRSDPATVDIPILFISAFHETVNKVRAFAAGGVDYITKPFELEEVHARVRTHLELTRQKIALQESLQRITEMQEQLVLKEKMASYGFMVAGLGHEIKNPLNFVINFTEISRSQVDDLREALQRKDTDEQNEIAATMAENLGRILEHGRRIEGILNGMFSVKNSSEKKIKSDLNRLLEDAVEHASQEMSVQDGAPDVHIIRKLDPNLQPIQAKPITIGRVFVNILNNAIYAAREHKRTKNNDLQPEVSVESKRDGDFAEIRIRDNGIGIVPENLHRIFTPFFTTKAGDGQGLGLAICFEIIVEQHGGTIEARSEPGVYTEFLIRLPAGGSEERAQG